MKFLHTSDWHIGRTLNGWSLLEEQKHAFKTILAAAKKEKVDGIIIAGDLYDRTVPSAEAVTTFNEMLREMNIEENFPVYAISGNHDGAQRLNYGREWLGFHHLHLNTLLEEAFKPIETDEVQIFLLPFFDPADARIYFLQEGMPEEEVKEIKTLSDALDKVIAKMREAFIPEKKQLLVTHFSVAPSAEQEIELTSETQSKAGGLTTVTVQHFSGFDYVALGHIHTHHASPSQIVRYSGSPVKFNVKEAKTKKGFYIVDVADEVSTRFFEIKAHRDLVVLEEEWERLIDPAFYQKQPVKKAWFALKIKNFDRFALAGKNLRAQLQKIYGTIVELDYDYKDQVFETERGKNVERMSAEEIVQDFYKQVTGESLSDFQKSCVEDTFIKLREEK